MKIITLWQPWASLIPFGLKQYETRSWLTSYRGLLLIHAAARKMDGGAIAGWLNVQQVANIHPKDTNDPFFSYLNLPLGKIVAIAQITDCIKMTQEFINIQSDTEIACGDWQAGRYAWKLEDIKPLAIPILCKGRQGLFNPLPETIFQIQNLEQKNDIKPKI